MTFDPVDLLAPPIGAILWLFLSWSYARSVSAGRPLNQVQRGMILYGLWFVLGMGYAIMLGGNLHWPPPAIFSSIAIWGIIVALVAFLRHRRSPQNREVKQMTSVWTRLKEWFPMIGLLVCLVAAAVEWSFWINGQARLIVALLWTAGIPATILLARHNRRTTVIIALRAFLGLFVIGTLTQPSSGALIGTGVTAVVLFLLESLWRNGNSDLHMKLS